MQEPYELMKLKPDGPMTLSERESETSEFNTCVNIRFRLV